MAELASNLRALEVLLEEFFSPRTDNARKAEMEKVLGAFAAQPSAWRDCLYFLSHSANHYVAMFALTTLESFIKRRWVGMLGADRAEVRTTLHTLLFNHHASAPQFIKNKLIKLLVDIARSDWPHFYPEFLPQVVRLVQAKDTACLGLTMLLTASEELATPREDLATARAAELRKLMAGQAPEVVAALTGVLEAVLEQDTGARTPPPSPSVSNDSEDSNSMEAPGVAGFKAKSTSPAAPPCLDPASRQAATLALSCVGHIFTWAPLHLVVSSKLIHILFQFSGLAVRSRGSDEALCELSVLALTAVTEIIYKSYVPADLTTYLMLLFKNSCHILQSIVTDQGSPSLVSRLPEAFLAKVTEFLRQFVASSLRRCGEQTTFPLLEFLGLVFQFTFLQQAAGGLLACLEVWSAVCDYLQGSQEAARHLPRYKEALLAVVAEVLRRVQHRHHGAALALLATEGEESEWAAFLATCLELVLRVAELLPEDVLPVAEGAWREAAASYLRLEEGVEEGAGGRVLRHPHQQVEPLLRDHCSMLQLCGRLCPLYLGHEFLPRLQGGLDTTKQLLQLAATGARLRLWTLAGLSPGMARLLMDCQAHTLAALQAWCHWLAALHSEALQDSSYTWVCSDLTSRIVVAAVASLREPATPALTHAAAHFLVTLTGTVRPPSIWKVKEFTDLYTAVPRAQELRLGGEAHRLAVRALSNVLLLHWPGIPEQKWEERRKHLAKFLRDLTEGFRGLKADPAFPSDRALQAAAEGTIVTSLQMLGDLVTNVLDEVTHSKKLCHDVTREYIELSLWLFPLYVQSTRVCEEMFHFFHIVFDVLAAQMGSEFVERAVQTFLSLFGHGLGAQVSAQQLAVVERFLSILTFIVSQPGPSFRKFVPSTLTLCLEHIFPLVERQHAAELRAPLYTLLRHTLDNNWTYFFKTKMVTSLSQLGKEVGEVEVQHREELVAVLRCIGQSFLHSDIAVFSQNVATLELLNSKWKLYSKPVFRESLLAHFLSALLRALVANSHNLLREEVAVAVYHMAATDLRAFHADFLPQLLASLEGLDANQRAVLATAFRPEEDMPSFLASIDRLVTDTRHYQLVNSSLDQPPVKL